LEHIYEALTVGKAEAALIASITHYGKYRIADIKRYLAERGVSVRMITDPPL
jgi:cyclase